MAIVETTEISISELRRFEEKVGRKPMERLQWALDFAEGLSPIGKWDSLRIELACFSSKVMWWEGSPDWENLMRSMRKGDPLSTPAPLIVPDDSEVREIQKAFGRIINDLKENNKVIVGPIAITYAIEVDVKGSKRREEVSEGDTTINQSKLFPSNSPTYKLYKALGQHKKIEHWKKAPESFKDAALSTFAELLVGHSQVLGICPDMSCGRWFVAYRTNQHYCSKRCQARTATRDYREREAKKKAKKNSK